MVNELVSFPRVTEFSRVAGNVYSFVWYVLYYIMKILKTMWQKIVQSQARQAWKEEANMCATKGFVFPFCF